MPNNPANKRGPLAPPPASFPSLLSFFSQARWATGFFRPCFSAGARWVRGARASIGEGPGKGRHEACLHLFLWNRHLYGALQVSILQSWLGNRGRFSNAPGPGVRLGFHGEFFRPSQGPSPVPGSRAYRPTGHQRRPAGKEAGPARRKQTAAAKESRQGQGAPAFPPRVVWQVAASGRHRPLSRPARFISPLAPFFSTSRRFCSVAL